ncbi:MAG: monovalent cation/H+ antiporter complex subunit F [Eubacteriales bacterium]|nr:monovalent cation/H+ antiporter complex subunit F [Eubacteriales bacterium]
MDKYYAILFGGAAVLLALLLFVCLFRAVRGPKTPDRIIAVNMIGSIAIALIALTAVLIGENYLADIALIYTMLSFVAVVLLCKIYIGIHRARREKEEHPHG